MWIQSRLAVVMCPSLVCIPSEGAWCLSSLAVTEGPGSVFVCECVCKRKRGREAAPIPFPLPEHSDWGWGGVLVITGAHRRSSDTSVRNAGGWFVVLGCRLQASHCDAVQSDQDLRARWPNTTCQSADRPWHTENVGHSNVLKKLNRFPCEGFKLTGKCRQFWKNILFVLKDKKEASANKRLALNVCMFKIALLIFLKFLVCYKRVFFWCGGNWNVVIRDLKKLIKWQTHSKVQWGNDLYPDKRVIVSSIWRVYFQLQMCTRRGNVIKKFLFDKLLWFVAGHLGWGFYGSSAEHN